MMLYLLSQIALDCPHFSLEISKICPLEAYYDYYLYGHHHVKGTLSFYFKVPNTSVILTYFVVAVYNEDQINDFISTSL